MFTDRQKLRLEMLALATGATSPLDELAPIPGGPWWPAGGMDVVVNDWLPTGTMMYFRDRRTVTMSGETLSQVMCAVYRKEIVRKDLERIIARVMAR